MLAAKTFDLDKLITSYHFASKAHYITRVKDAASFFKSNTCGAGDVVSQKLAQCHKFLIPFLQIGIVVTGVDVGLCRDKVNAVLMYSPSL